MSKVIKLFWWNPAANPKEYAVLFRNNPGALSKLWALKPRRFSNFGDVFSKLAVELVFGAKVIWAPPTEADLFALGSIMSVIPASRDDAAIWGTGDRGDLTATAELASNERRVLAVRGSLTRDAYSLAHNVSLGDPGFFISEMVGKSNLRALKPLYLPHFSDLNSKKEITLLRRLRVLGYEIVLPTEHPLQVAEKISKASFVVTTSLHGRIFADALEIPVFSVETLREPSFKFMDYASSIGKKWDSFDKQEFVSQPNMFDNQANHQPNLEPEAIQSLCLGLEVAAKRF